MPAAEGPLQEWATGKGLPTDLPSLCKNDEAGKWMLDELNVTAKESKLKVCSSSSLHSFLDRYHQHDLACMQTCLGICTSQADCKHSVQQQNLL